MSFDDADIEGSQSAQILAVCQAVVGRKSAELHPTVSSL